MVLLDKRGCQRHGRVTLIGVMPRLRNATLARISLAALISPVSNVPFWAIPVHPKRLNAPGSVLDTAILAVFSFGQHFGQGRYSGDCFVQTGAA